MHIAQGSRDPGIRRAEGCLGHPACTRFVRGLAVRRRDAVAFVPLYRRDETDEMRLLDELLKRLGGTSFRLDGRARAWRRAGRILLRHSGFVVGRLMPQLVRLLLRAGSVKVNYF